MFIVSRPGEGDGAWQSKMPLYGEIAIFLFMFPFSEGRHVTSSTFWEQLVLGIALGSLVSGICHAIIHWVFLVAQMVKNLPAMQETPVRSLGQKDPLEKGMATHSSILAWRIPWTEKSGELQSMESQRVGHDWMTNTLTSFCNISCCYS